MAELKFLLGIIFWIVLLAPTSGRRKRATGTLEIERDKSGKPTYIDKVDKIYPGLAKDMQDFAELFPISSISYMPPDGKYGKRPICRAKGPHSRILCGLLRPLMDWAADMIENPEMAGKFYIEFSDDKVQAKDEF
jgi:hypothetical protein